MIGSQLSSASDSTDNLNLDEPFSPFDIEKHRKILMELKTSPSQLLPFMQHSVSNSGQVHDVSFVFTYYKISVGFSPSYS